MPFLERVHYLEEGDGIGPDHSWFTQRHQSRLLPWRLSYMWNHLNCQMIL